MRVFVRNISVLSYFIILRDVLQELVEHGGDLELGGNTPLMEAAQEGHAQTVMYIVKASSQPGVCPNFISHASTAVGLAAENGHLDVIEILYTAGADLVCYIIIFMSHFLEYRD